MKRIVLCGGGSAGHVMPNIAVWQQLKDDFAVDYIGTDGIERRICQTYGIPFHLISAPKYIRGVSLKNLTIPVSLMCAVKTCRQRLQTLAPSLVFCKGGYVCLPVALAAHSLGIPLLTHESDITPGLANRLIAKRCQAVLTAFPQTAEKFDNGIYVGTPLRNELIGRDRHTALTSFGLPDRKTLLVFGGGSGSRAINRAIFPLLPELCRTVNVLHVTGETVSDVSLFGYRSSAFIEDMGLAYAVADYAVSRCGANAAFELLANRIPTLFIPLENGRSRGDQVENAAYFSRLGVCHTLSQKELTSERLKNEIDALMTDPVLRSKLSEQTILSGSKRVADLIKKSALKK